MRVLVADDDVVTRRLLESSLRRWGYDVIVACDLHARSSPTAARRSAPDGAIASFTLLGLVGSSTYQTAW